MVVQTMRLDSIIVRFQKQRLLQYAVTCLLSLRSETMTHFSESLPSKQGFSSMCSQQFRRSLSPQTLPVRLYITCANDETRIIQKRFRQESSHEHVADDDEAICTNTSVALPSRLIALAIRAPSLSKGECNARHIMQRPRSDNDRTVRIAERIASAYIKWRTFAVCPRSYRCS